MFIHHYNSISPLQTSGAIDLETVHPSKEGKLLAIEPPLDSVPPAMVRRMSKAVRMGIGAGMPILRQQNVDGIIIGTANGGMEDCMKFLNQIISYEEGMLTPGNFVQSTANAISGQLSLITKNQGYNATHVHLGLAFENALLDAKMLISENPGNSYLIGTVDEISAYDYNVNRLAGWYDPLLSNKHLYNTSGPATIAGEGAAMFLVNDDPDNAIAKITEIETLDTTDADELNAWMDEVMKGVTIDTTNTILISGENGDERFNSFYSAIEKALPALPVIRYKHATGEYPTAGSFAVWVACYALQQQKLPVHFYKTGNAPSEIKNIIIYNQYHGVQHSLIFVSK